MTRGWRPYAVLLLLCLGLYLPGLASLPVMDRDEARFAQSTRQMLETGDFLDIRFQDEPRNKKPVAIYWLQAAAVAALGDARGSAIWPYRLPSLAAATGAVWLVFWLGARAVGREAALLAASLLAASLGLVIEAHLAKTDAVLLLTVSAAQGALGEIYRGARARGWAALFWIAEGAAIAVKGPVAPALAVLTVASLAIADRDLRWLARLRPLWGVPLLLAIVLPWLVAISLATNGAFISQSVGHDFLGKVFGAQESHGAWPGTYLLLLPVTFWPGSLLLGAAALAAWRDRGERAVRFLIAWTVPFWFALELVPTKLPHYLLPAFPALALLAGRATAVRLPAWADRAVASVWALATLAIAGVLAAAAPALAGRLDPVGIAAAIALLLYGAAILRYRLAPQVAALGLVAFPALAHEAPRLDPLWLSRDAAAMVTRDGPPPGVPVAAVGYDEPSLVFLLGTATRFVPPQDAAHAIAASPGAVALVESRADADFRRAMAAIGWQGVAVDRVAGLDYSNGKRMVITLYRGVPE